LHPGQQVATHASMAPTPVAREIAWSRDVDRYLAVMKEMTDVRSALNEVHSPALRYRSRLLDRVPAGTFMYVAIPNITGTLDEAQRRIQQRIQQSEVLKDWFPRESAGKVSDQALERIL